MKIYNNVTELIGRTPLLRLNGFEKKYGLKAKLFAKLEFFNPAGSAKDRIGKSMIEQAEKDGILKPGGMIIEPTSGNTGIALAAIASSKGYKAVIVMPDTMSVERIKLIKAYGAEVVLTDGKFGMKAAIEKAEEISKENPGSFIPSQFRNSANPAAHRENTGPEIWDDTDGEVDVFVSCVGSGGTISGTGEYLKSKKPDIKIVAVEPLGSPVLSEGKSGAHKIQGIGAGFIPENLNTSVYDEVIAVSDDDAFNTGREIPRLEGILTGISSGAAVFAAISEAKKPENEGKSIVVLLTDTGERYLSSEMFSDL